MANLVNFKKIPRNVAKLVDFSFYKRKSFEGEPGSHPHFLSSGSHSRAYFSSFFFTVLRKRVIETFNYANATMV